MHYYLLDLQSKFEPAVGARFLRPPECRPKAASALKPNVHFFIFLADVPAIIHTRKTSRGLSPACYERSAFSLVVSLYPPHRCIPIEQGLAILGQSHYRSAGWDA